MNEQLKMILAALQGGDQAALQALGINTRRGMRERNQKVIQHVLQNSEEVKNLRESMKRKFKLDIFDDKTFPVREWNFSWKKLAAKLEEADSSSSFTQFLRAGIQNITNAMYESVQTTYEDWVTVVASNKDTELYAPNHGVAFPRQIGPQTPYPEVGVAALDLQLKNRKHGSIYGVERELLEDDQTGSFQRQAGMLGEYLRLLCEVLCYGKLASVSGMKYIDYEIPVSETKPSGEANYPWTLAAAPLIGGGVTKATPAALSQSNVQNGIIALMNQKNLQGIKMQVSPNRLLIGPRLSFDAAVLIHSSYYPSGAAAAGNVGGAFAINPLKSMLDITVSRFMFKNDGTVNGDSTAWYIVDDSKPFFVMQMREAATVVQEAPNSGESFNRDIYRFKASSRQNADFIDPRFAWQGNDGSV
jgi:hypothetical protein